MYAPNRAAVAVLVAIGATVAVAACELVAGIEDRDLRPTAAGGASGGVGGEAPVVLCDEETCLAHGGTCIPERDAGTGGAFYCRPGDCYIRCTGDSCADSPCPPGMPCCLACNDDPCIGGVVCEQASSCMIECAWEACAGEVRCGGDYCAVSCNGGSCTGGVTCEADHCEVHCLADTDCGGDGVLCGDGFCDVTCDGCDVNCGIACGCLTSGAQADPVCPGTDQGDCLANGNCTLLGDGCNDCASP